MNYIKKKKKDSTGLLKLIYKTLLNKILGKFELNVIKPIGSAYKLLIKIKEILFIQLEWF